jgi:hypothetical protein
MTYVLNIAREIILDCHGKSSIEQEEGLFHQTIALQFREETTLMLHLKYSIVWC